MEGGGAQESDDITSQPLKDELFSMPPLQFNSSVERVGLLGTALAGRTWTEGLTTSQTRLTPEKVSVWQGLVQMPQQREVLASS